jgi:hypothetical protein
MLSTTYPGRHSIFNYSPNSPTSVYCKALLMQGILAGTLLVSIIIPTVNGQHALQVYSGRQSLNFLHVLYARADLRESPRNSHTHNQIIQAASVTHFHPNWPIWISNNPSETPLTKTLQPYECQPKPLSPQTWKELQLDEYIKTYPKALEINLDVGWLNCTFW